MSISNIQNSNISSLLSKAYNTDNSAATSKVQTTDSKQAEPAQTAAEAAVESAKVILGGQQAPQTYTAQGLMQQLRQYQLDNTAIMFGDTEDSNQDDFTTMLGGASSDDTGSNSQDLASTISKNPDQAALTIERSKNSAIQTIFGNK